MFLSAIFINASSSSLTITYTTSAVKAQQFYPLTYALVVAGTNDSTQEPIWHRADMMYNTLQYLDNVAEITYYTINGTMSGQATKAAVLDWITNRAWELGPYDTMLIFFSGHGGGMNKYNMMDGGEWDYSGDEGAEHWIDGAWKGVDECLYITPDLDNSDTWEIILDDEMAAALDSAVCRVTVILNACKPVGEENSTLSCFSGGFIDDLSGFRRCIITSSNETWYSLFDSDDVLKGFTYYLIEAIGWGWDLKSAFEYAFENDEFRHWQWGQEIFCYETPQYDDDGDCLPNYQEGQDQPDPSQGKFASLTVLGENTGMLFADGNFNGIVDIADVTPIGLFWGLHAYEEPRV